MFGFLGVGSVRLAWDVAQLVNPPASNMFVIGVKTPKQLGVFTQHVFFYLQNKDDTSQFIKIYQKTCKLLGGGGFNYFHPYLGMIPILTNMFQLGCNHQLDWVCSIIFQTFLISTATCFCLTDFCNSLRCLTIAGNASGHKTGFWFVDKEGLFTKIGMEYVAIKFMYIYIYV